MLPKEIQSQFMIQIKSLLFLLVMTQTSCVVNHQKQNAVQPISLSKADEAVDSKKKSDLSNFAQIIDAVCSQSGLMNIILIDHSSIIEENDWKQTKKDIIKELEGIQPETLLSFELVNKKPISLKHIGKLSTKYEIMSDRKLDSIFNNGGWEKYYKMYPTHPVITQFTNIGINESQTQALIGVGQSASIKAADGRYYLLEYKDQKWFVRDMYLSKSI